MFPDLERLFDAAASLFKWMAPLALLGLYQLGEWAWWIISHLHWQ